LETYFSKEHRTAIPWFITRKGTSHWKRIFLTEDIIILPVTDFTFKEYIYIPLKAVFAGSLFLYYSLPTQDLISRKLFFASHFCLFLGFQTMLKL